MSKLSKNITSGTLVYKQFIQLADGTELQVRYNQNPDLYAGTDVKLYSYTAREGKGDSAITVTKYAVSIDDAIRAKKTTTKDTIASLKNSGLSDTEIVAKLLGL